MYKYIRCYKLGYEEGYQKALEDSEKSKINKFIEIDDYLIMAKLYDIGFINGYNNCLKTFALK